MKLKIAITGAITNDRIVAKSTNPFRSSPNWNTTREPIDIRNKKKM
ncbi:MAG: hypothetical protein ACRBB5_00160 [Nitrosopumilus sp.]